MPAPNPIARVYPRPHPTYPAVDSAGGTDRPYVVNGRTYVPAADPGYDKVGEASWYGAEAHAQSTAMGERFDPEALTGAHPTLPLPSLVYVTNLRNNRTIMVRINDRGPFTSGRIIDLSKGAAKALAIDGVAQVRVRWAARGPLQPDASRERAFLAAQPWNQAAHPPYGLGADQPIKSASTR